MKTLIEKEVNLNKISERMLKGEMSVISKKL